MTKPTTLSLMGAVDVKFHLAGGNVIFTVETDHLGPITRVINEEERMSLLDTLDTGRLLRKLMDERDEAKREWGKISATNRLLVAQLSGLRRVLRIFRDFVVSGATVWKMGTNHHHPMWEMVSVSLGDENSKRPSPAEWAFIYPENKAPLEEEK